EEPDVDVAALGPSTEPGQHRFDRLVGGEPSVDAQLRGHADLGVDHAVGGEVFHALVGHPFDGFGGLHARNGVFEGLEVQVEVAAVGTLGEPRLQLVGVGGGQRVSGLGGQLDDGGRAEPAVVVVVQE